MVVQFTLSISLIIGTGVVYSQLNYLKSKKLGFEQEHTIYIPMRGVDRSLYAKLKTELEQNPELLGVSGGRHRPSLISSNTDSAVWEGKDPELDVSTYMTQVDYDFFETMGIEFVEGRSFSKEFSTDEESAYIINEELVKILGVESAEKMRFGFGEMNGQVIPNFPFEFRFMDEDFDSLYRSEMRMGGILKYFAGLAVFTACLGLLGLASFAAEQRTKEIGISKVLGASSPQIGMLIYREFILLLAIANLVAWPLSYLVMLGWLQDFAYRTHMNVLIFILAALAAAVCAFLTVSYQALKASLANPVKALRYE